MRLRTRCRYSRKSCCATRFSTKLSMLSGGFGKYSNQ